MSCVILSATYSGGVSDKKPHDHDCHQILYITEGRADIRVNQQEYTAKVGDLVIFSRFECHSVTAKSDDYRRYVLQISPHVPGGGNGYQLYSILFNRPDGFCNLVNVDEEQEMFRRIFDSIVREKEQESLMSEDMLNLLTQQLLISIYRHMPQTFSDITEDCFEIICRIQNRFEWDYQTRFTLAELAEEYGVSVFYLSHLFRKITGHSVMGYLQSCRIAAAKKFLAESDLSISQVVSSCGFSDSSNFSRTFRACVGCSPSAFRKRYQ